MSWYLKKSDGNIYGPAELQELQLWAMDGRVAPDDALSEDKKKWSPAPARAELGMEWHVTLPDGNQYGPIHLLAIRELIREGSVSPTARVSHKRLGQNISFDQALLTTQAVRPPKPPDESKKYKEQAEAAEKQNQELQRKAEQEIQAARKKSESLEAEIKELQARHLEAQKEIDRLTTSQKQAQGDQAAARQDGEKQKKAREDERNAAGQREARLQEEIQGLRAQVGQGEALRSQIEDLRKQHQQDLDGVAREIEKWKRLYDEAHARLEEEKAEARKTQEPGPESNVVPKARFEEVSHKLAQLERLYQQLLKISSRGPAKPTPTKIKSGRSPETYHQRDIHYR